MPTSRLEAFSDGVIAIIITIMVLELKVPHGTDWSSLRPLWPVFASYILSFVYVGIYWNNHHHLLHVTERINGTVLWANLHLLFWMSLIPFVSGWMGENELTPLPVFLYGAVLFCCGLAYLLLEVALLRCPDANAELRAALGKDYKGKASLVLYAAALPLAYVHPLLSIAIYVLVALLWLVPDPRLERSMEREGHDSR